MNRRKDPSGTVWIEMARSPAVKAGRKAEVARVAKCRQVNQIQDLAPPRGSHAQDHHKTTCVDLSRGRWRVRSARREAMHVVPLRSRYCELLTDRGLPKLLRQDLLTVE